jgi:hypothetical protein
MLSMHVLLGAVYTAAWRSGVGASLGTAFRSPLRRVTGDSVLPVWTIAAVGRFIARAPAWTLQTPSLRPLCQTTVTATRD